MEAAAHLKELLKDGKEARFRNERKRFLDFAKIVGARFPHAVARDGTLVEPFRSLVYLVTIGQRPITSLLMLEILLKAGSKPLTGREIGRKLAKELEVPPALTTAGGNYKDRIGDLLATLCKTGILEEASSTKAGRAKEKGFRIKKAVTPQVRSFLNCVLGGEGVLSSLTPAKLSNLFKSRFDLKYKYVIKSGTQNRQPFSIGKIMKSLLSPKIGISFEDALALLEEVEPDLKSGMKTVDLQSLLYNALKKRDEKAAENYRQSYPQILTLDMSDGRKETVNYKLVKTLIGKEVKLKLTSSLLDKLSSTVYKVVSGNPSSYQSETAVREYIYALVRSECMPIRSTSSFVEDHLESARSALEGAQKSAESDEVNVARNFYGQFLEQVLPVVIVELGYLPFKDYGQNVELISNLLKESAIRERLADEFKLAEQDLFQFQRIKYLMQSKDKAKKQSLAKLIEEGSRLLELCEHIQRQAGLRAKPQAGTWAISLTRVSTGYEDLDRLLLGGVPEGYAVLLTGPSCDERDLLIEKFLRLGASNGQMALHVTIDARVSKSLAEEFPSYIWLLICNPEADAIIGASPNVFKVNGTENLTEIEIALTSILQKMDARGTTAAPRLACIEIVSDVLLQHQAVAARRWLSALIPRLESKGFTTLATLNPHMHSPQAVQAILDLFQGEIHIYKKKTEKGLKQFLRIEKLYNQEYQPEELILKKERMQKP